MSIIEEGLKLAPKDKNLILVRSYIHFYRHHFFEALCDIEAVIEIERASSGEEEPNATDLLHRGRCHACLSMFKEAITDFNKVIELDDELFDAYFFRGKCSYLIGDTSQAFLDFQKLIMIQPKNPMVHAYAGNLLMTTGSYDDATKAFSNANKVSPCAFAIYQRARCHLALGDVKNAASDLQQACKQYATEQIKEAKGSMMDVTKSPNPLAQRDKECLEFILTLIEVLNSKSTKLATKEKRTDKRVRPMESDEDMVVAGENQSQNEDQEVPDAIFVFAGQGHEKMATLHDKLSKLLEASRIELREVQDMTYQQPDQPFTEKQAYQVT